MWHVVEVDGIIRSCIDIKGKANKYGKPKEFETADDAARWIKRHSYTGMSVHYEIVKEGDNA